jgi:tetratricopeptide (TPR) repeat protein
MNENAEQQYPLDRERQLPHLIATSSLWGRRMNMAQFMRWQEQQDQNRVVYNSIDDEIYATYRKTLSCALEESSLPLLNHPLFQMLLETDNHIPCYLASEDEIRDSLVDFNTLQVIAEAALRRYTCFLLAYLQLAHLMWRSYHLVEVRPMLEAIVQVQPYQAETWFYLGQLYADDLGKMDKARQCFERFLQLKPSHRPPNNYCLSSDYASCNAYEPCTQDAYANLARIAAANPATHADVRALFAKAIAFDPTHHLAPYAQLAEFIMDQDRDFREGYRLYALALANHLATIWSSPGSSIVVLGHRCQNTWIAARYPLTAGTYFQYFVERFEVIGTACYLQQGDAATARRSLGIARRLRERFHLPPSVHLFEMQIALAFSSGDYWQVQQLCRKILRLKPQNQVAIESLQRCRSILGY